MNESFPLDRVNEAYERMESGQSEIPGGAQDGEVAPHDLDTVTVSPTGWESSA